VTRLINRAADILGVPRPDTKALWNERQRTTPKPFKHAGIADPVLKLVREDLLLSEIADKLGVTLDVVRKVVQYLRDTQGIEIPDGRARRKSLLKKARERPGNS
jgi:hypothetical protein